MACTTITSNFTGSVPSIAFSATNGRHTTVLGRLWLMLKVRKERQHLAQLDERALRDLGLSAADITRETDRSFLDVPADRY